MSPFACILCHEEPREGDPGMSAGVCCFCGYWRIPPGAEREKLRAERRLRVPITVEHITRPARPSPKDGKQLPAQDYVFASRPGALGKQKLCIGKDEWVQLRAEIDAAFGVTP